MILPSIASDIRGSGLATGLIHRFRYVARLSNHSGGQNGNGWIITSMPYLHFSTATIDGMPAKVVQMGGGGSQWEWSSGIGYIGLYGTRRRLFESGGQFRVFAPDGALSAFHGPAATASLRGRLVSSVSPLGIVTNLSYDGSHRITSEVRSDPATGNQAGLHYEFANAGSHSGRILAVEKRLSVGGVVHPVHRWLFEYHNGSDSAGSLNDLKSAEEQVWDPETERWAGTGKRCFRYYKTDTAIGFVHGLRYMLDADGYARMEELGLDPGNVSQVSDVILGGYAAQYFEYTSDHRYSKVVARAGTETTTITHLVSDGDPGRNWSRREIATQPDGSTVTTYFDSADRVVFKLLQSGTDAWADFWVFNADNRETLHATSSAIASFTEPTSASQNFSVTLKTNAGHIETKDYYPASGGGSGSAPLHLKLRNVKEGSSGTAIKQQELTYVARSVGGDSIDKTAHSIVYRDSSGGGSDPATTAHAYTWRGSTFAVLQHTVTPPVIGTAENGTGAASTRVTVHDEFGNAQWSKNERGRIDYAVHDRLTGALRFRIDDADTGSLTGVPSGWSTPSGFGSSRRTDCQSDLLGRATLVLGPIHPVAAKNKSGVVESVLTRRADFACYLDASREVRSAKGGSTGSGLYTLATVTLRRLDFANRELESIEASRACECGPVSASEDFPQSTWKRWRQEFYNTAAYRDESRVWHVIPTTGEGFENVNYYATRFGRDSMGRENRVASPGGTIKRSIIDARGFTDSVWIGTNDTGATDTDPTGGGASGNNLVLVTTNVYDGGSDGGNGNLTSVVRPVDTDSADDRTDFLTYDFRDRLIGESRSDGTRSYLTRRTLDNRGLTTLIDSYHTSDSAGNLTARTRAHFDARGRNYRDETFSVDPTSGAVGNALVAQRWRDPSGNVIKETIQGSEGFVKRTYNAFEQVLRSYTACNPSGGSHHNNPAADIVVEQGETLYDAAGNTVQSTAWQRYHDATGTGPLHGPGGPQPKAIRRDTCRWQDALGREIAAADYGTRGGAVPVRPSVPPAASEEVLVTITRHASTGGPGAVIDPMGTETRWQRDAMGREITTIENFKAEAAPASDVNRTTCFAYHPGGGLETLSLLNAVTGDQTTRWVYGTTLTDSAIATGHLLRTKLYPESDDRSAPLGDGPDGIYERTEHTYNRQGEVVTTKDPNETVHSYGRDPLGRMIHDRVTAFGAGIVDTIKRISTTYDPKRPSLVAKITSYDHTTPGSGSILNEVAKTYNGFSQEVEDTQSHAGAVGSGTPKAIYTYVNGTNNTARRTAITYPGGRIVNLGYGDSDSIDDLFSLVNSAAISGESGDKVAYTRAGLGRFVKVAYPQPGVELSMIRPGGGSMGDSGDPYDGYDRFGRVQEMRWQSSATGTPIDGWQWGFNEASNRTWKKNLVAASGQDEAYVYDGLSQVTRDAVGTLNTNRTSIGGLPGEEEDFIYDPTGNWLAYQKRANGTPVLDQTRSSNQDNQLTRIDGRSALLAYDRAGNATQTAPGTGGDWTKYLQPVWDAWNRLVEVKNQLGASLQKNTYDGLSRRITQETAGVVTHTYWSDRWKPLEERIGSATTAARSYLWGERPGHRDELVLRDRDTDGNGTLDERLYATMDYFNGTAVLNPSGVVQERYAYSAFGVRRILAADFTPRSSSNFAWDFGFQGQFRDGETGWYNYGYRFYVPELGRWINRDPIGERGGSNLYLTVNNNTLKYVDRYGLTRTYECCDEQTIESGSDYLKRAWEGSVKERSTDPGIEGDSCSQTNFDLMNRMGESPKCWTCSIENRAGLSYGNMLRMGTTDRDHWIIHCIARNQDGEQAGELTFDGTGGLTGGSPEYAKFCTQWPDPVFEEGVPLGAPPDIRDCSPCNQEKILEW